jgi:deoxyribonuclease-4
MFFGAHVSVAGGLQNGPLNAAALGCEVFQFFSRSPQGGPAPKITPEMQSAFLENCAAHELKEWVIHAPYYLNFASGNPVTRANSARIIREELERATLLSAKYVMFHPGSAKDVGESEAVGLVVEGLKQVYKGYTGSAQLLIEISAGAGKVIGDTFEEVAEILSGVGHKELGVCFDTAHAFASGYDLRTRDAIHKTFQAFDAAIGLQRLKMSHCNDSKVGLGERKDRHEHLGMGQIGLDGFKELIAYPGIQHLNLYLETDPEGVQADLNNLKTLRKHLA